MLSRQCGKGAPCWVENNPGILFFASIPPQGMAFWPLLRILRIMREKEHTFRACRAACPVSAGTLVNVRVKTYRPL